MREIAVYIHLPFCKTRCAYCDFFSTASAEIPFAAYAKALVQERRRRERLFLPDARVKSVYIGGGTPSLWPAESLAALLGALPLNGGAEITVEVNPRDGDRAWFAALATAGVTRFSIGVQALRDERLRFLGRTHTARDAVRTVEHAIDTGACSVSADLIYGTPGQTPESLESELSELIGLGIDHLSAYELTVAENTPLGQRKQAGEWVTAEDDTLAGLYRAVCRAAETAGFAQYEVSNWAREGRRSVHNLHYWQGGAYCGLGAGAHGFFSEGKVRFRYANGADVSAYMNDVFSSAEPTSEFLGADGFLEQVSDLDHARERMMLGLRTVDGVSLNAVVSLVPDALKAAWQREIERLQQQLWITVEGDRIVPAPAALLHADALAERFF